MAPDSHHHNRKRSRSRSRSPPRQRKRPGAASRTSAADRARVQERQAQREVEAVADAARTATQRGSADAVRQHYNAVPQRGREWRRTDSRIRNLRAYNNWAKSALIHKFGPGEDFRGGDLSRHAGDLAVLDIGCGKGGDLGKWQKAPQRVGVYVGIDPAEVSIEQARERHAELRRRSRGRIFDGHFFARDGYNDWVGDIPVVREIGVDAGGGGRWGGGGFDVVTMMFCMHYSFESEGKARGMLRNVASALKKGGRFIGVIPDSDVIRARVESFYAENPDAGPEKEGEGAAGEQPDGSKPHGDKQDGKPEGDKPEGDKPEGDKPDDKLTPAKPDAPPADTAAAQPNGAGADPAAAASQARTEPPTGAPADPPAEASPAAPHWGNSVYSLAFPATQPPPRSGAFRPPFAWRYQFFLTEAVESVPEYVVPFEAFRALAAEHDLELQYRRNFHEIWREEGGRGSELGQLAERMGVPRGIAGPETADEWEAVGLYAAFCFYKT